MLPCGRCAPEPPDRRSLAVAGPHDSGRVVVHRLACLRSEDRVEDRVGVLDLETRFAAEPRSPPCSSPRPPSGSPAGGRRRGCRAARPTATPVALPGIRLDRSTAVDRGEVRSRGASSDASPGPRGRLPALGSAREWARSASPARDRAAGDPRSFRCGARRTSPAPPRAQSVALGTPDHRPGSGFPILAAALLRLAQRLAEELGLAADRVGLGEQRVGQLADRGEPLGDRAVGRPLRLRRRRRAPAARLRRSPSRRPARPPRRSPRAARRPSPPGAASVRRVGRRSASRSPQAYERFAEQANRSLELARFDHQRRQQPDRVGARGR